MATIQSDPTLDGFNSFVSADEADTYFAGVYFGDAATWDAQTNKEALLITATRRLSNLTWEGAPFIPGQALAFPRTYILADEYGTLIGPSSSDTAPPIPQWLKDATCEMAMWMWSEGDRPFSDVEFAQLKSQKIGPLDYVARDNSAYANLPPSVLAILRGLGSSYIYLGGARSLTMSL